MPLTIPGSASLGAGANVTAATFTVPTTLVGTGAAPVIGNLMVAAIQMFNPGDTEALVSGTGWTPITQGAFHQTNTPGGDQTQVALFQKVYTGTPGPGAVETICTFVTACAVQTQVLFAAGQATSSAIDTTGTGAAGTAVAAASINYPNQTLAQAGEASAVFLFNDSGFTYTTAGTWTQTINGVGFAAYTKTGVGPGAVGAQAFTATSAADQTVQQVSIFAVPTVVTNGTWQDGFVRDPTTAVLATDTAAGGTWQDGFVRNANGNLCITTTLSGCTMQDGFMRDANGYLLTVPYASASGTPVRSNDLLRDANLAVCTVTTGAVGYVNGFVRDVNNALVIE